MTPDDVTIAGESALAAIEKIPVGASRRFWNHLVWISVAPAGAVAPDGEPSDPYRDVPHASGGAPARSGKIGRALVEARFRWLGTRTERSLLGGFTNDVFAHPDGLAYVLVRPKRWTIDPGVLALSPYWIMSFFADGTCMETSGRAAAGVASPMLLARAGTQAITADVESHLADVAMHARKGSTAVVPVRTIDDVKRMSREYWRRCVPTIVVVNLATSALFIAAAVGGLVYVLFRWARS